MGPAHEETEGKWCETNEPTLREAEYSDLWRGSKSYLKQFSKPAQIVQCSHPATQEETPQANENTMLPCSGLQLIIVLADYVRIMTG